MSDNFGRHTGIGLHVGHWAREDRIVAGARQVSAVVVASADLGVIKNWVSLTAENVNCTSLQQKVMGPSPRSFGVPIDETRLK